MAPYRTFSRDEVAEAPRDGGIVGDVIAQFADPLAFYRELVQNSIDAGTPSVEIQLTYDGGLLRVAVRDRGEGMTRDILEQQLLVLFRSTKEADPTKIGKFGIGFVSVLAPDPDLVVVQTARDGRRLVLHLARDLTYQLFDAGPATQTGTVVELELRMPIEQARELAHQSLDALVRWCRHATVPIELVAELPGLDPPIATRIDRPLGLDGAVVEVRGATADGQLTAIVGIATDATPYGGFFNHGLTLHETREPLLGRLAFKIQDARLGHTLSRDNVRRDESFKRAVDFARSLAERELPNAIARVMREAAEAGDQARYERLVLAVASSERTLEARVWQFPLVEPVDGRTAIGGDALGRRAWASTRRSALTAALAAAGRPVLQVAGADWVASHLREALGVALVDVDAELTLVTPLEPSPQDLVLLGVLGELIEACHRAPAHLVLAQLTGAHGAALAIAGDPDDSGGALVDRDVAASNPFARLRRRALVLGADHALVRAARLADDPTIAASHLARAVLLQYRLLDEERSATILDRTLGKLGLGGST